MAYLRPIFSILILLAAMACKGASAENDTIYIRYNAEKIIVLGDTTQLDKQLSELPAVKPVDPGKERRQKIVSALFAFPFPFGFMGAHRIMLGCKPWVPVVYVATFGGCFGLLPMIDFCAIVFSKDLKQYENNPHIFMWLH